MTALRLFPALIPLLCWGASAALAQAPPESGERFFMTLPDGWQEVTREEQGGVSLVAFTPGGQGVSAWEDMIVVQIFETAPPPSLESLFGSTTDHYQQSCEAVRAGSLQPGESNGYSAGFWVLGCNRNAATNAGETAFFRVIEGEQASYLLQRSWRTPAYPADGQPEIPAEEQQEAMAALASFTVCDPGRPAHPCPQSHAPLAPLGRQ